MADGSDGWAVKSVSSRVTVHSEQVRTRGRAAVSLVDGVTNPDAPYRAGRCGTWLGTGVESELDLGAHVLGGVIRGVVMVLDHGVDGLFDGANVLARAEDEAEQALKKAAKHGGVLSRELESESVGAQRALHATPEYQQASVQERLAMDTRVITVTQPQPQPAVPVPAAGVPAHTDPSATSGA